MPTPSHATRPPHSTAVISQALRTSLESRNGCCLRRAIRRFSRFQADRTEPTTVRGQNA